MIGRDLSRWIYHFIPTFWIKSICLWAMLNVHSLWSSTTISPSLWGSCLKRQKLFHYVLWSHCLAPTLLMFQENRSAINLFFHLIYSFEEPLIFLTSISLPFAILPYYLFLAFLALLVKRTNVVTRSPAPHSASLIILLLTMLPLFLEPPMCTRKEADRTLVRK